MEVSLVKGEKVDLTKGNAGLLAVGFGVGWDINKGATGTYDLDLFAFALNKENKLTVPDHITYFGNKEGIPGVRVSDDNLTGEGEGDDETVTITFDKIHPDTDRIILGVNIFEAASKGQRFGMVQNSYIRAFNSTTDEKLNRLDLNEDFGSNTGVVMGQLYRHNGEWKFEAIGKGVDGDINQIVAAYVASL